jgi:hypothetical protein
MIGRVVVALAVFAHAVRPHTCIDDTGEIIDPTSAAVPRGIRCTEAFALGALVFANCSHPRLPCQYACYGTTAFDPT